MKPSDTLIRVAKYYFAQGFSKRQIHRMLEEFLLRCDSAANIVKWQPLIQSCVKAVDRRRLLEADSIVLTQKELETVQGVCSRPMERTLFTMLAFAKYSNLVNPQNENWINRTDRELFRCANVQLPLERQAYLLHDLRGMGLIRFSRRVDNINIQVLCLDAAGDTVIELSDFRNLGYQYNRYLGEPYFSCIECGITVRRKSPNQKYCSECGVDINRKNTLLRWRTKPI